MYSVDQIKTAINDPRWLYREPLRKLMHRKNGARFHRKGVDVIEEDWDNLLILDAARYDEFERALNGEVTELEGHLEKRISRGATSSEFIWGNFDRRHLLDTVYVSVNPHFARYKSEMEAEVFRYIPLHDNEFRDAVGGLTTRPETVTKEALKTHNEHPNKRLIVHYLQPHQPYLGESADSISHGHGLVDTINRNNITKEQLKALYRENLQLVLSEAKELLMSLPGRTVITSDHGELLGDKLPYFPVREYGHWAGMYVPELLEVPWFVSEATTKKDIEMSENPYTGSGAEYDLKEINQQLEDLGYKT